MPRTKIKGNEKIIALGAVALIIIIVVFMTLILSFAEFEEGDFTRPTIAVIPIKGAIEVYGGQASSQTIVKLIDKAKKDDDVKAIIFEINSPGGTVVGSEEIAAAIKNTKKPTVAWTREIAASGAYWAASATDKIVADPATITGSIGVSGSYLEFSELMENWGIGYERLVSGKYKDTGSPYKDLSPEERELLMKKINAINELFINAIAENRGLNKEYVRSLATGEIFLGTEAYELGLVDILGGKKEAIKAAEQLAGIEKSKLEKFERKKSIWDLLSEGVEVQAYWIGRGIGDSWNLLEKKQQRAILAELS